jgi:hypothetical protein
MNNEILSIRYNRKITKKDFEGIKKDLNMSDNIFCYFIK